jgi:CubicO group peptidase (beta-lactamase class C family)
MVAQADSVAYLLAAEGRWHGGLIIASPDFVLYRGASGERGLGTGVANAPEQPFDVLSISKSFTAVAALQMVGEGTLDLQGTVGEYLPSYAGPGADDITVHDLLSHRSGVPDYVQVVPDYWTTLPQLDTDSVLSLLEAEPLEFPPGEGFAYSNSGYVLLAAILEHLSGAPYADIVRRRVFDPLGMVDTRWVPRPGDHPGVSTGHQGEVAGEVETVQAGEAGIVSTLDDMLRFARSLGSEALLSAALWEQAFTPHSMPDEARRFHPAHFEPYGYGFSLAEVTLPDGTRTLRVSHGGAGVGRTAMLGRVLGGGGAFVVWNNRSEMIPTYPELDELISAFVSQENTGAI